MEPQLWEIESCIQDAADALNWASRKVYECSGAESARFGGENEGRPKLDGWPAMLALQDAIDQLASEVKGLLDKHPEIAEAIKAEREHNDEMADRADGLSY
jgi:hypothetical protein